MSKKYFFFLLALFLIAIAFCVLPFIFSDYIAMLNPKGIIALKEKKLMLIATALMLIVVIPVFILTVYVAWKYRAGNTKAEYDPNWNHSILAETVWWGFPFIIIAILSVYAYESSHELDPYRPLQSETKPLRIQVVALQWKWLFIYPEQNVATVNFIQFPEKTPINFEISADAPMNSFWIPQLGGQVYAMPGMTTKLHLIADEQGLFSGYSANISGVGFAGMTFKAQASSEEDFNKWVADVKKSTEKLNVDSYKNLAEPSKNNPVASFVLDKPDLFEWIVMLPMHSGDQPQTTASKQAKDAE
ncbi:MAG: ubiquinol oxidase subunit II [Parachlamydiales bacterium]|jgi:cytochrome o ubiquinol oxidase subunit 2